LLLVLAAVALPSRCRPARRNGVCGLPKRAVGIVRTKPCPALSQRPPATSKAKITKRKWQELHLLEPPTRGPVSFEPPGPLTCTSQRLAHTLLMKTPSYDLGPPFCRYPCRKKRDAALQPFVCPPLAWCFMGRLRFNRFLEDAPSCLSFSFSLRPKLTGSNRGVSRAARRRSDARCRFFVPPGKMIALKSPRWYTSLAGNE